MSTLLTAVVLLAAFYIYKFYEKVRSYPRGPFPLPVLGNLLHIEYKRMHEYFHQQSQIYGPVFTVWMPRPYVVITDYHLIKEAFQNDDFAGRTGVFPENLFQTVENGGISFSQGNSWKEQRRVSIHILRDFGMGKNVMEQKVGLAVEGFLANLKTYEAKGTVDFRVPVQVLVTNVINEILYGFQYKYDNCDRLIRFVDQLGFLLEDMRESVLTVFAQNFAWFQHVPYFGYRVVGSVRKGFEKLHVVVDEDIKRCLKGFDETQDEPVCFAQAYMQRMRTAPEGSSLCTAQLKNVCSDFFMAGSETTATTLKWAMLFMAQNQTIQETTEQMVAFSVGKRQCAGESLARMELFMTIVSILQHYKIEPLPDKPLNMEPRFGFIKVPESQELKITRVTA